MSEKKGILRSRYIGVAFAVLLLLIAGITVVSVFISGRNLQSPEGIEKEVCGGCNSFWQVRRGQSAGW